MVDDPNEPDAIERLNVIEAKALHARDKKPDSQLVSDIEWLISELRMARAENERLRTALVDLVTAARSSLSDVWSGTPPLMAAILKARKVLGRRDG